MKKLLLTIGSAAAVVAPLATVVACGSEYTEPETFYKKRLLARHVLENPGRYLDVEGKKLLWDNIETDGFDVIYIGTNINKVNVESDVYLEVEEDWLINTDMNLPSFIIDVNGTFEGAIFDNPVTITKDFLNPEGGDLIEHDYLFNDMFANSTLNYGITFEQGITQIPESFLYRSNVSFGAGHEYKITLPDTLEYIGGFAFHDMDTDSFDYDFTSFSNLAYMGQAAFGASTWSDEHWLKDETIILPASLDISENNTDFPIFMWDDIDSSPTLIQYRSEFDWGSLDKQRVVNEISQVGWSNIY